MNRLLTPTPPPATVAADIAQYYRRWLEYRRWYLRIPGIQAAVLQQGDTVLAMSTGVADESTEARLTDRHLFRIASHSKTFTAVAVLQLAEEGRLRLDDPITTYLPALAAGPLAAVTIRDLLTHSGGVIRDSEDGDFWQLDHAFPSREALIQIGSLDSAAVLERNDRYKYSNIGYGLLGLVIEAASGSSYQQRLRDRVINPLGLADTGPEFSVERQTGYAAGHTALSYARHRETIPHVDTRALAAATGFYATASDLARFFSALLPGDTTLLSDQSRRLMTHPHWQVKDPDTYYGMGVFLTRIGDHTLFGHSGGYPGHITRTIACPDRGLVVAALTNCIDGGAEHLATAFIRLADLGAAAERNGHPAAPDPTRFTGRFSWMWGVLDVAAINGRLFAINPTVLDPAADPVPLAVIDDRRLKVIGGPGGGSLGEMLHYRFATDGTIESVRGASGMTMKPFSQP